MQTQTDRQADEANSRFSQVWERLYKHEIVKVHFWGNEKSSIYYGVTMNSLKKKMTACVQDTKHCRTSIYPKNLLLVPLLLTAEGSTLNSSCLPSAQATNRVIYTCDGKETDMDLLFVSKWVCYWYNIDQNREKEMIWSEDIQFPMFYVSTLK
jgi:hypothetical protein